MESIKYPIEQIKQMMLEYNIIPDEKKKKTIKKKTK
jgi:hypothetical protein